MKVHGATLHYEAQGNLKAEDYYFASIDGENWVAVNRLPEKAEDAEAIKTLIEGEPYDEKADDGTWPVGYTLDKEAGNVRPILFTTRYLKQETRGTAEFHDPIGDDDE